jgi:hypothetical protein
MLIRLNGLSSPKVMGKNKKLVCAVGQTVPFSTHIKKIFLNGTVVTVVVILFSLFSPASLYFKRS